MNWLEAIASLSGLVCVVLVVLRRIQNFAFGILSTALFVAVFFEARLYSDALLQVFFVAVNGYGWWRWARDRQQTGTLAVKRLGWRARIGWALGIAAATGAWGTLMHRFTDASYPWADGGIAIASVAAQWLMAERRIENWWLWIAVDAASIPLYAAKLLSMTMALYILYLGLAIWGLIDWQRARRSSAAGRSSATGMPA